MYERFINHSNENNIFKLSDRILVAVSGGIDSMVMAELFMRADINIAVAHCNFKLRDRESDEDENFVKGFCKRNNIPFFVKRFETIAYSEEKGIWEKFFQL